MKDLTSNETAILVAILSLDKEAYGVAIKDYIATFIHKKMTYGTLPDLVLETRAGLCSSLFCRPCSLSC